MKTFYLKKHHHSAIYGIIMLLVLCNKSCVESVDTPTHSALSPTTEHITEGGHPGHPSDDNVPFLNVFLVQKAAILIGLSLLPFFIILLTSFLKMVIVLSLLRQAVGVQNAPPNQAINGMALIIAIYVMFPTGVSMYQASESFIQAHSPKTDAPFLSNASTEYIIGLIEHAKEPMRTFLIKNSLPQHRKYFAQIARRRFPPPFQDQITPKDFIIVVPSFITSQIKAAFEIGVLIYLPFFVIDLVVSNILLAMGMMMLSPLTIALPLKLFLLVMVDGWTLLVEGIVLTYK